MSWFKVLAEIPATSQRAIVPCDNDPRPLVSSIPPEERGELLARAYLHPSDDIDGCIDENADPLPAEQHHLTYCGFCSGTGKVQHRSVFRLTLDRGGLIVQLADGDAYAINAAEALDGFRAIAAGARESL